MEVKTNINLDKYKDTEIMSFLAKGLITQEEFLCWKESKAKEQDDGF